ncbi:calcium/sodium antiporter [Synechocystis sp. FACHB-383]|uniref:calcium/sodium antiporter n=1 Tax=Synechocystis sp. FACHB-383 TaxID=2692864 RepID=UPI001684C624|nr:calcium/sodium antiporter [Synechocystis sp. FACHB-383]MBD2652822.1 calcium/sodium antiporter [Synechocystis sp. FACHB-383]
MTWMTIPSLVLGLGVLVVGAEILVKGASRIALMFGISPLIIGLTIVAYGTSAPELVVSLQAVFAGQADISIGNVVGSNIFNILLILGVCATITPLVVAQQLIRLDVPILIAVSALLMFFAQDGRVNRLDGSIFVLGAILYTTFLIFQSRREKNPEIAEEYAQEFGEPVPKTGQQIIKQAAYIGAGMGLLIFGSRWLVESSVDIARALGISELVIGLTLVSLGTSLPELATSVVASYRGERDIAVGNVVGSNIFNILAVLGFAASLSPTGVAIAPAVIKFDLPVMFAVAVICLPVFLTGRLISRWEGILFLGYYFSYATYLVLSATSNENLSLFTDIILFIVIPATAIALGLSIIPNLFKGTKTAPKSDSD